ncbi:hypothetical protein, conserved, partial [Eimeria tenella]
HPRNIIHIDRGPPQEEGPPGGPPEGPKAAGSTLSAAARSKHPGHDFVRQLALGAPGLSLLQRSLALNSIIEDCHDIRLAAAALQGELEECPASHVAARGQLQQQLQHTLLQAAELLLLRHCCTSLPLPMPFLLDFWAPAICPSAAAYVSRLRQHYLRLQQQQQQQEQQQQEQQEEGFLGALPPGLNSLVTEGRSSTKWLISSVSSSSKGLRLLLLLLPMLTDACTALLLQGLLLCPEALLEVFAGADAVLAAAAAGPSAAAAAAATEGASGAPAAAGAGAPAAAAAAAVAGDCSLRLFEEVMRSTGTAAAALAALPKNSLLSLLLQQQSEGHERSSTCCFLLLGVLRVLRAAGPSRTAVLCSFLDVLDWGLQQQQQQQQEQASLVAIAAHMSGACLLALLTIHLPRAEGTANPGQMKVITRFLCLVTEALVSLLAKNSNEATDQQQQQLQQQQQQRLRPLIRCLLQQARQCPAWAATITTQAMSCLGEAAARAFLASLVSATEF